MIDTGRHMALHDPHIEPAQATADIINFSAEKKFDPADHNQNLRLMRRQVLEKMMGVLDMESREEIFHEAVQFVSAERTHLRDSEVLCLAIAYWSHLSEKPVGYSDVLAFSYEHMEKPMSDGTVWKAFAELVRLGLFHRSEGVQTTRAGRPREMFNLTSFGVIALNMAISYARHLSASRAQMAA